MTKHLRPPSAAGRSLGDHHASQAMSLQCEILSGRKLLTTYMLLKSGVAESSKLIRSPKKGVSDIFLGVVTFPMWLAVG